MASTESATNLSGVLDSVSAMLVEFRSESAEIESQFFELVAGIAELGPPRATAGTLPGAGPPCEMTQRESLAIERLESLDRSIARQREEFGGRQDRLSDDVGQLRELVDQHMLLFAALVDSPAGLRHTEIRNTGLETEDAARKHPIRKRVG